MPFNPSCHPGSASSEQNYLEIAIRLGLDHEWRWQIIEKLQNNYAKFEPDTSCVQALEEFYKSLLSTST